MPQALPPDRKAADVPEKKTSPITAFVLALALLFAVGLRVKDALELRHVNMAKLTIHDKTYAVELADTSAKRELGLGKRDSLPADHGMYFPFPNAQYWVFWMKDMRFPIDIVWIADGKVVDITRDAPVPSKDPLRTFSPVAPADAVLELNAGTAAKNGILVGDDVAIVAGSS